ncbi:MAG: energy transducer TonB [Rhodanobacteraceae bacterium]
MIAQTVSPHRVRGAVVPMRLALLVGLGIVVIAAAWWFFGRNGTTVVTPVTPPGQSPAPAQISAASPVAELPVDQLYQQARAAMADNRMVGPAGNNALEDYLAILAKDPTNTGAQDALRELFPFATGAAEDQINQGNFDEANRIIDLLTKADPNNYSLTILRSKLDAKKKLIERDQAQQATTAAPTTATAEPPAATEPAATPVVTAPAPPPPPAPSPAEKTPTPAVEPKPAVAVGETRDAQPIKAPAPQYPLSAVRNRQQGWVEVEFTVGVDGTVQNATVIDSRPAHVFDQAALSAVQRATYRPRLDNGKPVPATLRRRIEFKLGG